ncbi:MAG: hypothetical protein V4673_04580 [Pseudomonadota bacterium]
MKQDTCGFIIPTDLFLATGDTAGLPIHASYDPSLDRTARVLERYGYRTQRRIYGDLPFGLGFASSTVLAALHLSPVSSIDDVRLAIQKCDREVHGFEPSGMDFSAISSQTSGFYSRGNWRHFQLSSFFPYSIVTPPPERLSPLSEIELIISRSDKYLIAIANKMTSGILSTGSLDYDAILDYSKELSDLSIYSRAAKSFIDNLLENDVAAKAIGGLYDKAIIVIWKSKDVAFLKRHLLEGANVFSNVY